jgi:hypothetical protein
MPSALACALTPRAQVLKNGPVESYMTTPMVRWCSLATEAETVLLVVGLLVVGLLVVVVELHAANVGTNSPKANIAFANPVRTRDRIVISNICIISFLEFFQYWLYLFF